MNIPSLHSAASAMSNFATGMNVTAHNIANVSTAGFQPQHARYADGPNGQGMQLHAIMQGGKPARPGMELSADAGFYAVEAAITGQDPLHRHPSGTELCRELPIMIATQHAFNANAAVVRTADELLGTVISMKV